MPRQKDLPDGMLRYTLPPPVGGVNTQTFSSKLKDGEYENLNNTELAIQYGVFGTRKGYTAYNATRIDGNPIRGGVRWYYGTSSKQLVVACNTQLYKGDDGAGTFSSIKTGLTADKDWSFPSYLDILYPTNGTDAMLHWDGTTMRNAGFAAPGSAPTVATGAAGVLTGAYIYKVTFVYDSNSAHESSASTASSTVNPTADQVDLSSIPTGGTGCTARNIYRTEAGGADYYFLATISDNSTTTYSDNIADSALGTSQAPTDNGVPPTAQFAVFWKNRMVAARTVSQPQRIYLSAITSTEKSPTGTESVHGAGVEIFPASHFIDVGDNNSPIMGLALLQEQLVIFKEDAIYILTGDDAQDLQVYTALSSVGCIAPKTIVLIGGMIYFLGRADGSPVVYKFDGSSARPASGKVEPTLRANIKALGDTSTQAIQPAATRYRSQYVMAYAKVDTSPVLFECAVLCECPDRPRWMFWDKIQASCFIPWNGRGDSGEMYFGSQQEGRVLKMDDGHTDYGSGTAAVITATVETPWLDLDMPNQQKQINHIEIYAKANTKGRLTVDRRLDFNGSGSVTSALNMSTVITGNSIFKVRIDCGGSDQTTPEICYFLKLVLSFYGSDTAISAAIEITDVFIYYTPKEPLAYHEDGAGTGRV